MILHILAIVSNDPYYFPLYRKVRQAERYNWASTRGVNEERIFENLPEDLQRNIRRHLFRFVNKVGNFIFTDIKNIVILCFTLKCYSTCCIFVVCRKFNDTELSNIITDCGFELMWQHFENLAQVRIFALMNYEPILDAIRERLRQRTYIEGSEIFTAGDIIEKMVFIVRGKMESRVDGNGIVVPLSEGDVCGEELLTWCLEHSSINRGTCTLNSCSTLALVGLFSWFSTFSCFIIRCLKSSAIGPVLPYMILLQIWSDI